MNFSLGEPRVLGAYIDNGISYFAEMDKNSRNPIVYNYFTVETPSNIVAEDGSVVCNDEFRNNFIEACKEHKIVADKIIFTVDSGRVINREILIPYVSANKVSSLIHSNASEYFPVDISEYKTVHKVIRTESDSTGKKLRVNVYAVPRDILRSYYDLAGFIGFEVETMDYSGNSIYQCIKAFEKPHGESEENNVNMYITMDSNTTMLTFVKNGELKLQRHVNIGYGKMLEQAAMTAKVSCDALIHSPGMGFDMNNPPKDDEIFNVHYDKEEWKANNLDLIDGIVPAISRSMEYFLSLEENGNATLSVYLVGAACKFGGFREYLSDGLGVEIALPELALKKNSLKYVNPEEFDLCEYIFAVGACVMPINITDKSVIKTVPALDVFKDSSVQRLILLIGVTVFIICMGVAVSLWFIPRAENAALQNQSNELKDKIAEYGNINSIYSEYENWTSVKESVSNIHKYLYTYNDNLVFFIEEFERKMPSSFKASSINISETGVSMSIAVESRAEAAYVIMTLREMKSVSIKSISNVFNFSSSEDAANDEYVIITDANYNLIESNLSSVDWLTIDLKTLDPQLFAFFGIDMTDYVDANGGLKHENINKNYQQMTDDEIRKGLDDGSIDFFELLLIKKESDVIPSTGSGETTQVTFSVTLEYTGNFENSNLTPGVTASPSTATQTTP